jgi:hypothetical protein
VYQGQKVHLFRPSLGFLTEAQPRLKTGKDQAEVHINFLGIGTNYKAKKTSLEKLQIHFVSTFFK